MPGGAPREGEDIPGEAVSSSSTPLALAPQVQGVGGVMQGRWGGRTGVPRTHSPGKSSGNSPEFGGGGQ